MSGCGGRTKAVSQDDLSDNEQDHDDEHGDKEAMTCNALCSLAMKQQQWDDSAECFGDDDSVPSSSSKPKRKSSSHGSGKCCPKQLQLPMFLSKTYHMIDKCDSEIATWSEDGDNFVVKNVEKFAGIVLPLYFKHSNFSSFARQLNFYGFRKLRSEAILTAEADPSSACYVRFYHENFQRDKPELLAQIKRATKGDQQSKDDLDTLRIEICNVKETLRNTVTDYDRKLAELSYECNRRISSMNAEYDKLAALVQHVIGVNVNATAGGISQVASGGAFFFNGNSVTGSMMPSSLSSTTAQLAASYPQARTSGVSAPMPPVQHLLGKGSGTDLLHSLSRAAVSLKDEAEGVQPSRKRPALEVGDNKKKSSRGKRNEK